MLRYQTRRTVFWSMVAIYLVTATLVMLFANGYRVRISPFRIARTGNILATFEPAEAQFFVDGSLTDTTSPVRVRALFPGTHQITIQKDGFIPFVRTLRIEPHRTAFVNDIFLIPDAASQLLGTTTSSTTMRAYDVQVTSATIAGNATMVSSSPHKGTFLMVNDALSRDIGSGTWHLAGGDDTMLAIANKETGTLQLRSWKTIDAIAFEVHGSAIMEHEYNNTQSLLAFSPFELWHVDTDQRTARLISRVSKPIVTVIAIPETTLVAVVLPDEILAYQLGEQNPIPTSVVAAPDIVSATLNANRTGIVYTVREGDAFMRYERTLVQLD